MDLITVCPQKESSQVFHNSVLNHLLHVQLATCYHFLDTFKRTVCILTGLSKIIAWRKRCFQKRKHSRKLIDSGSLFPSFHTSSKVTVILLFHFSYRGFYLHDLLPSNLMYISYVLPVDEQRMSNLNSRP